MVMGLLNCIPHLLSSICLRLAVVLDMAFFLEWPFEGKFFFIFGCLVAIVLPTAGLIRTRNTLRTTRHTLLVDEERAERTMMTQVVVEDDTVFGITAMEKDEEVEGLWNSKTSTPLHTPLPSPRNSFRSPDSIRNAFGKLSHSRRESSVSSLSGLESRDDNAFKRVQGQNIRPSRQQRAASLDGVIHMTPVRRSQSLSTNQDQFTYIAASSYSQNDLPPRQLEPKLEQDLSISRLPVMSTSAPKRTRRYIIGGTSASNNDFKDDPTSASCDTEVLDRMDAHRRFHAAESGQLLPRRRRLVQSSASFSSPQDVEPKGSRQPNSLRSVSWPSTNNEVITSMTVPHGTPQRQVSPTVIPFSAFVETHAPPKACPSAWTHRTQELLDHKLVKPKGNSYTITAFSGSHSVSPSSATTISIPTPRSNNSLTSCVPQQKIDSPNGITPAVTLQDQSLHSDLEDTGSRNLAQTNLPRKLQKRARSRTRSDPCSADGQFYHQEKLHSTVNGIL